MTATTRADLHVHSTASQISRLGVQRALGLPECATAPHEVYELANRRGMNFVTITDHDTIAGALQLADRPDAFISEELTAGFAGEPQQVHVPHEFLAHVRAGRVETHGDQGSAAKWAHCAMALAVRALGRGDPGAAPDPAAGLGVSADRIGRWDRGVDIERFDPRRRVTGRFGGPPGRIHVLYAGRQATEKGADLLAESFLVATRLDPRLHLVLAGGGPEAGRLQARLGDTATFLGWLGGDDLAIAYASADLLLFCSQTDAFGNVVLEAQASGLPVVAVDAGGPAELIESGRSGLLCPPA